MSEVLDHPQDAAHEADDRTVHALLAHALNNRSVEEREDRLARLIMAIDAPPAPPLSLPSWGVRYVWAAAASVLLVVGIVALLSSPSPALASLNEIITALSKPGDRTFTIHVEPDVPEADQRPGLNGATLSLRDGRQYVLARVGPNGGTLYDGFDGRQSWRVRNGTVVEQREGPGAGGIGMPQNMSETAFTDLTSTLQRLRSNYNLEMSTPASLSAGGPPLRHVIARRKSREVRGPETIEIWADFKTAMPHRIVFDQGKFQGSTLPRRLTLGLTSESPLPPDWFEPRTHVSSSITR